MIPAENTTVVFAGAPMNWNNSALTSGIGYYRSIDTEFPTLSDPMQQQTQFPSQQFLNQIGTTSTISTISARGQAVTDDETGVITAYMITVSNGSSYLVAEVQR